MANSLNIDLEGKVVLLRKEALLPQFHADEARRFLVTSGFGAKDYTAGTSLGGRFLIDGEACSMNGYDVECLAPDQTVTDEERARFAAWDAAHVC